MGQYITDSGVLLKGYCYSTEEILGANGVGEILCLRLETNYQCNLDCIYCYSYLRQQCNESVEMSFADACDVIDQGVALGLKSVVYLGGGEPFMYSHFWELLEYMHSKNVVPVIFTNGMLIDKEYAHRLYNLGVSVMIKMDGLGKIQNWLTGADTYSRIHRGLENLMEAGFNKPDGRFTRLGVAPCVTMVNLHEVPDIWRFARQNNIFPNIEKATQIGRATSHITIGKEESQWLTKTIQDIDLNEFNIRWSSPYSSITAHSCGIFKSGLAVTVERGVALCPEMEPVANLAEVPLAEIINQPPFTVSRNIEKYIDEPCRSCEHIHICLGGCRSKALLYTGSITGCDTFCHLVSQEDGSGAANACKCDVCGDCGIKFDILKLSVAAAVAQINAHIAGCPGDESSAVIAVDVSASENAADIENILKIHVRDDDMLIHLNEDRNTYLFVCGHCGTSVAKLLHTRLSKLLQDESRTVAVRLLETNSDINAHVLKEILG